MQQEAHRAAGASLLKSSIGRTECVPPAWEKSKWVKSWKTTGWRTVFH
jgi:hypothetical protein